MIKHVAVATICLCVVSSCAPQKPEVKLVATSKEEYEKSLILMAAGLSSKERMILSNAITIIQDDTKGLDQIDNETNKRIKVSGKSRMELINEARTIVIDWYRDNADKAKLFTKYKTEMYGSIDVSIQKVIKEEFGGITIVGRLRNRSNQQLVVYTVDFDNVSFSFSDGVELEPGEQKSFRETGWGKSTVLGSKPIKICFLNSETGFDKDDRYGFYTVSPDNRDTLKYDDYCKPNYIEFLKLVGTSRPKFE